MDLDDALRQLVETYYESDPTGKLQPGCVCGAVVPFFPPGQPLALHFDYDAANEGRELTVSVGPPSESTFNHRPVYRQPYELESNEALIVQRAKRRPVVVLTEEQPPPFKLRKDFPPSFLCCPIYRFKDHHPSEFLLRVKAMEYPMLFFLRGDDRFNLTEGFARLDRIVLVPKGYLRPRGVKLTEDAWSFFQDQLDWFIRGLTSETLSGIRKQLLNCIQN